MLCLENTKSLGLVKQCRRLTCYNDLINSLNQDNKDLSQTITDQEKEIVNLKAEVKSYATVQKILDGLDKKSKK